MAALHNVAWEPRRAAWGEPFALSEELKRLDYLLDRPTLDPAVVARAPELRERLRASLPACARIGCVHGDFQWSNVLFHDGTRGRADRLGNLAGRRNAARPRLDLFFFRSRQLGRPRRCAARS